MLLVHLGFPTYCGAQTGTASRSLNSSFYLNSEEARSIHQTGIHRSSCDMLWRRWWQCFGLRRISHSGNWEAMTLRRPRGKLRFRSPAMLLVWCFSHAMPCVDTRQDAFSMLLYGVEPEVIRVALDNLTLRPVGPWAISRRSKGGLRHARDILELPLGIAGHQASLIDSFF